MKAVSDTSPIILLDKAGHLWILEKLFKEVIIPPAVDKEWLRPGGYKTPQWLSVGQLSSDAKHNAQKLAKKMDKGEAEAIALFQTIKADAVLLDDLKGRKEAELMGLPVVGTIGILVAAKRKGIIPELTPVINILKKHRYYLSDEVLEKALTLAGER